MKKLIKRFTRVADSSSYCLLRSEGGHIMRPRRSRSGAPPGHVPVYVGEAEEEMDRFTVSAGLLNHPVFVKLLNRSAQEYGYQHKGVLRIPCHVADFERLVSALISGADVTPMLHSILGGDYYST